MNINTAIKWMFVVFTISVLFGVGIYMRNNNNPTPYPVMEITAAPVTKPTPTFPPLPPIKEINNNYQVFQTYNNCGPAALSMVLSYYGIDKTQQELGQDLRPFQNPQGDNDDKSVTLEELSQKASEYNLISFHRPNGSIDLIKQFIAQNIPIVTRTLLNENDDIGHYRIIKGYNDAVEEVIQDDSLQGHNIRYSYKTFMNLWRAFNYEYVVLVPPDKEQVAISILGGDSDLAIAWKNTLATSESLLGQNPNDTYARFNVSVALYHTGDIQRSIAEFEKVEDKLPIRTLWYQIEPIQAYYELGDYEKVFTITNNLIENQNRAFSELYIIRGDIYKKQGDLVAAREEYKKAVFYNQNLLSAKRALMSVP